MIGKSIKEVQAVTLSEVVELLERRKQLGPLGYEQQATYDYAVKMNRFSPEVAKSLVRTLVEDYGLQEEVAVNIVNVCPRYISTLKVIASQDKNPPNDEKLKEILELIKKNSVAPKGEGEKNEKPKAKKETRKEEEK